MALTAISVSAALRQDDAVRFRLRPPRIKVPYLKLSSSYVNVNWLADGGQGMLDDDEMLRQHRSAPVERMMALLSALERQPEGMGLRRLAQSAGVTRSTAYRMLNSLLAHEVVRQLDNSN